MLNLVKKTIESTPLIAIVVALAAVPLVVSNQYFLQIGVFVGIYVILVSSLNLLNGYVGMMAIGHAAFYGIGAYASTKLMMDAHAPFLLAFLGAGLIAGAFGYLLGRPTLRLEGIYLALATLAFNLIVWLVLLNWNSFTNGPLGIRSIPAPDLFGWVPQSRGDFFYLMLGLVCIVIFVISRLVDSRFGRALVAIREDQLAAAATGINVTRLKVQAFVISAFFAGLAGAFYAHFVGYISPDSFMIAESFVLLTMLALGGQGNIVGPIVGAAVLVILPEVFRSVSEYRMLLYGIVLIAVILTRPRGLFGGYHYNFRLNLFDRAAKRNYRGDQFLPTDDSEEAA